MALFNWIIVSRNLQYRLNLKNCKKQINPEQTLVDTLDSNFQYKIPNSSKINQVRELNRHTQFKQLFSFESLNLQIREPWIGNHLKQTQQIDTTPKNLWRIKLQTPKTMISLFLQLFKFTKQVSKLQMKQIIESGEYINRNLIRQNRICAGAIFFFQVAATFFHGFFVRCTPTLPTAQQITDLLPVTGVAFLVLIGFGLIFSPAKNNIWSSLGFTFFITVITLQIYHLISGFWTLVNLSSFNSTLIWSYTLPIFLADSNAVNVATYGNTAVGALKCALANSVAFAGIMGRAGLLPALIVTVVGSVMYEINRHLISRFCLDFGGSIGIFCWGGIYGSTLSLILYYRKHKNTAQQNQHRIGGKMSYTFVGIGALFCWVFFPFLNTNIPVSLIYSYQAGINCFYCMSASVLTCIGMCCLFVGQLNFKDFVYSPVVGGVIIGSSAGLITNTVGAILLGIVAGVLHFLLNRWEVRIKWYFLIENNTLFLYGIQGIVGGLLSSVFVAIAQNSPNTFNITASTYALPAISGQLIATGITVSIALGTGVVVGMILTISTQMKRQDHYHDRAFWLIEQDCISQKSDINDESQLYKSQDHSSEVIDEKHVQVFRQIVIPPERGNRNKFVQL